MIVSMTVRSNIGFTIPDSTMRGWNHNTAIWGIPGQRQYNLDGISAGALHCAYSESLRLQIIKE